MDFSTLSQYDDILACYFVDSLFLWFRTIRMNKDIKTIECDADQVIKIIRQDLIPNTLDVGLKKASESILKLQPFQDFTENLPSKRKVEFKNHVRKYLAMFSPTAGFEVTSTTRYTGKYEACITATKDWSTGDQVKCCMGAIAELNDDEDSKLKSDGLDFSVLFSSKKNCTCLFLGPARFMNHDCEANCSFTQAGLSSVTFKVNKNIMRGEEMTAYYGDHYFGINNCECLCKSCEKNQKGGFAKKDVEMIEVEQTKQSSPGLSKLRRSGRAKKDVDYKSYSVTQLIKKAKSKKYCPDDIPSKPAPSSGGSTCSPLSTSILFNSEAQSMSSTSTCKPSPSESEGLSTPKPLDSPICCRNSQGLPLMRTQNNQLNCARCFRHLKIFGHKWPIRKVAPPKPKPAKALSSATPPLTTSTEIKGSRKRKLETEEEPVQVKRINSNSAPFSKFQISVPEIFSYTYKQMEIDQITQTLNESHKQEEHGNICTTLKSILGENYQPHQSNQPQCQPLYNWLFINSGMEYNEKKLEMIEKQILDTLDYTHYYTREYQQGEVYLPPLSLVMRYPVVETSPILPPIVNNHLLT